MRRIRIAVAGLGVVGRRAVRLLKSNRQKFLGLGARVELAAVADREVTREARALGLGPSVFRTRDPQELLAREPDVVVELLGGLEAPRSLVLEALRKGRHVVTANKRLLAHCWEELQEARASSGGRLYFEASVAGGIPLLQSLESLSANRIEALYGILNGTTNYVLSRAEEGAPLPEALAEAQGLGLAEKDPSLDLSGQDTAQKLSVLASLVTGAWVRPEGIARQGITQIESEDLEFARARLGRTPRLLGVLSLDWGRARGLWPSPKAVRVEAHVFPTLVPLGHPLAGVRREYNAVFLKTSEAADLMFYGKGAGPGPAASAVVGDIFLLARDLLSGLPAQRREPGRAVLRPIDESLSCFYLRLLARDRPGVLARIASALARRGVSIASIHQSQAGGNGVPIILTTHPTSHGRFRRALSEILGLGSVARRHTVMRILA